MTPAATHALRASERYRAKLDELIIKGVDSTVLDVMFVGLRKMKGNLSSGRRLAKASRKERPNVKMEDRSPFGVSPVVP